MKWILLSSEPPPEQAEVLAYDPVSDTFGICWWYRDFANPPSLLSTSYQSEYGHSDDDFDPDNATHWAFLMRPDGSKVMPEVTIDGMAVK